LIASTLQFFYISFGYSATHFVVENDNIKAMCNANELSIRW